MTASGLLGDSDPQFYLTHNTDVAAAEPAGITPASWALQHFLAYGWQEGCKPDVSFNTRYYLAQNPDVVRAGVDPLLQTSSMAGTKGATLAGSARLATCSTTRTWRPASTRWGTTCNTG